MNRESEGGSVLTALVAALMPSIDDARRIIDGRALAIVSLAPSFVVQVTVEGRNGEAVRVLERPGDAELGEAAAAFVEFALRNHSSGAALTKLAASGFLRFVIWFDEGEHRACLRAEMAEGSVKVGELRGQLVAH